MVFAPDPTTDRKTPMGNNSQQAASDNDWAYGASGSGSGRLEAVQQHLLDDPSNLQALTRAGMMLHEMGRFEESAAHLARAISSRDVSDLADAHGGVLMQMGDCYAESSDTELAQRHYHAARALCPSLAGPYVGLGTMALQGEQLSQAREFFETAAELQPDSAEAYGGLAIVHEKLSDYAAAFEMHLKCLELDTDNLVALLGLFQISCRMGTFAKIIHFLEVYLRRNPTDTSVLFCLATLYAREGRLHDARRVTMDILSYEPEKEGAAKLLAQLNDTLAGVKS
jgi:tetratricopeptide (TPR) repeat protein